MRERNNKVIEILILCILAFSIRLFLFDKNALPYPDSYYYLRLGYNFIRGNFKEGISWFWPMLYPIFAGFFSLFIKDFVLAGYVTSITFGSLLIIPSYLLAYNIFDKKVARYTGLFIILYPFLIRWSNEAITEMTYTFFFMCVVYFCWKAIYYRDKNSYIKLGISAGLCFLTRSTGLFVFILAVLVLIIANKKRLKLITNNILILTLVFSCFFVPYILFEKIYTGYWTYSMNAKFNLIYSKQRTFLGGKSIEQSWLGRLYPDKSSNVLDDFYNSTGFPSKRPVIPTIKKIPILKQIKGYFKNFFETYKVYFPEIFPSIILVLSSLGFVKEISTDKKRFNEHLFLIFFTIVPIMPYFYCFVRDRYFITMVPIIIIFSGAGLTYLFEIFKHKTVRFAITILVFLLLVLDISSFRTKLLVIKGVRNPKPIPAPKVVGSWLKENYPGRKLCIMDTYTQTALYAGPSRLVSLPAYATNEEMIKYARLKNVDFIIIGEQGILANDRYRQKPLLDPQNAPEDLELVYRYDKDSRRGKTLVYKLKK